MAAKKITKTDDEDAPLKGLSLKEVQKVDPEKRRMLGAMIKRENAKAKKTVLDFADNVPNPYMRRKPFGIMQLDIDMAGGLPCGGLSLIAGPDGSGKTVLLYKLMAMQQRIYGEAATMALAPVEQPVDHFFMRACGVQVAIPDDVIDQKQEARERVGLPLFTKDEIKDLKKSVGTIVLIQEDTAESCLNAVLDFFSMKTFHLIGIDSFSAFQTDAEADAKEGLEQNIRQAAAANVLTRFSQKFHPMTHGDNFTSLVGTCQVRANRERSMAPAHMQKYIRPYIPVIPWALRHAMLIALLIWPGEKMKDKEEDSDKRVQTGKVLNWETFKGKVGVHEGIRGEVDFKFDGGVCDEDTIVEAGLKLGVIRERDGRIDIISHFDKDRLIYEKIPGVLVLKKYLVDNVEFEMRIRQEILAAARVSCVYW
jgi:archaellum biogenesis ATPase FlaH